MKAVVYTRYGPPGVLQLTDVPTPAPKDNEVLVRVAAVSVNRSDWETLRGTPLYSRIGGPFRPRHHILGSDIAGKVQAAGRDATLFRPGQDVFGDVLRHMGGFAQYVCVPQTTLAPMPARMIHEEAAALPQAGAIALQGIGTKDRSSAGRRCWSMVAVGARACTRSSLPSCTGPRSPGWTTRRSWSSCAHSAPTTSSTTRGKTSLRMVAATT